PTIHRGVGAGPRRTSLSRFWSSWNEADAVVTARRPRRWRTDLPARVAKGQMNMRRPALPPHRRRFPRRPCPPPPPPALSAPPARVLRRAGRAAAPAPARPSGAHVSEATAPPTTATAAPTAMDDALATVAASDVFRAVPRDALEPIREALTEVTLTAGARLFS